MILMVGHGKTDAFPIVNFCCNRESIGEYFTEYFITVEVMILMSVS